MTATAEGLTATPALRLNRAGDRPSLHGEIREILEYRDLLGRLVHRDLTVRYKRSILGFLWTLVNPLLLMAIFVIVFSALFRFDLPHYETYFLSEYLGWNFFAQTTVVSMTSMAWNGALMKRVRVPKSIFALSVTVAGLVNFYLSLISLFVIMLIVGAPIRPAILFLPVSTLILGIFTLGLSLTLSSVSVFFSDIREMYAGVLITAWMYLTPIMYPIWIVPQHFQWVLKMNPMYYLLEIIRIPIYNGQIPSLKLLLFSSAMAVTSLSIGWQVFRRLSPRFYPHL